MLNIQKPNVTIIATQTQPGKTQLEQSGGGEGGEKNSWYAT